MRDLSRQALFVEEQFGLLVVASLTGAGVEEVSEVLETVVGGVAADFFQAVDHVLVAAEVGSFSSSWLANNALQLGEEFVVKSSAVDFLIELILGFAGHESGVSVDEVHKLDVSRANSGTFFRGFNSFALLLVTNEVGSGLTLEAQVTVLHNVALVSLGLDGDILLLEGLLASILGIGVFHPDVGEEITKA